MYCIFFLGKKNIKKKQLYPSNNFLKSIQIFNKKNHFIQIRPEKKNSFYSELKDFTLVITTYPFSLNNWS